LSEHAHHRLLRSETFFVHCSAFQGVAVRCCPLQPSPLANVARRAKKLNVPVHVRTAQSDRNYVIHMEVPVQVDLALIAFAVLGLQEFEG
jgi:hypothetical protein